MYIISFLTVVIISKIFTEGASGIFWPFNYLTMMMLLLFDFTLLAGSGFLKDFNNAFRLSLRRRNGKESVRELKRAVEAVRLTRKATLAAGMFLMLFETTQIIITIDFDKLLSGAGSGFGEMLMSGLTGLLYASAVILILLPMESMLRLKLWNAQETEENQTVQKITDIEKE